MAITVNRRADRELIYAILGSSQSGTWTGTAGDTLALRLYKGAPVLGKGDSRAYFIEASAAGYAKIYLAPTSWTVATLNAGTGDTSMASYAQQSFTFTAADSVAGYFMTRVKARGSGGAGADSIVLFAELFSDGPYKIPSGGGVIKCTPRLIVS
ncbi:MAG TPA: hypothetical protein VMD05_05640 [Candidatus Nanoarchaeia archaeon]|nr:hypothetical protein [Candidatus Nanoarchaeia archaeon]